MVSFGRRNQGIGGELRGRGKCGKMELDYA
jgi:hypothetical protein